MTQIAFRINPSEKEKLMTDAKSCGINISWILRRMVHLYLQDEELRRKIQRVEPRPIMKGEF